VGFVGFGPGFIGAKRFKALTSSLKQYNEWQILGSFDRSYDFMGLGWNGGQKGKFAFLKFVRKDGKKQIWDLDESSKDGKNPTLPTKEIKDEFARKVEMQWKLQTAAPAVLHMSQWMDDDPTYFIMVMEAGVSNLGSWIRKKPSIPEVKAMFKRLVKGLQEIYTAGAAHCDISIIDVRLFHDGDSLVPRYATCRSLLPGEDKLSAAKDDILKLGEILFDMLSGNPASLPHHITAHIHGIKTGYYPSTTPDSFDELKGLQAVKEDTDLFDLLKGVLAIRPDDRLTIDQILNSKWVPKPV